MQIPILNGIYTDEQADYRTSYPLNLIPVPKETGISKGYLRPADGITEFAEGPQKDRGGINWNGVLYRVMGDQLVTVSKDGLITNLGFVGGSFDKVSIDYSFDRLAIASDGGLYLWDNVTLERVKDADLGTALDLIWVDGYFMTTDGEFLVVTDLNNPLSVNPLRYGSSEADPDPIKALIKVRNEPHALNRYTIEAFDNVGGTGFPFQRIDGAQIQRGTVGTHSCCLFLENLAFVGGGRNESIAIWLGINGQSVKISTREIDQILDTYSEDTLSKSILEARVDKGHQHLYLHLPDKTLVYDAAATEAVGEAVWFVLSSSLEGFGQFRLKNIVRCYDKWIGGDPQSSKLGQFTNQESHHWGQPIRWEFSTQILYNEGRGAIFHDLELVCLPGRSDTGKLGTVWTSYSKDGEFWSQRKGVKGGGQGNRRKRFVWLQQGGMRNWRIQRFEGDSNLNMSFSRLEARLEPLGY